jgi:hypothetical protein
MFHFLCYFMAFFYKITPIPNPLFSVVLTQKYLTKTIKFQDGVPIASGPELIINTDGGASTLDIGCARFTDAAWYQCTAQNIAGSTATRARLFVEVPKGQTPEPRRLNLPRPSKIIEPE